MKTFSVRKKIFIVGVSMLSSAFLFPAMAETYVVVGKNAKVFDEANSNYVTLNQKNQEVAPQPGMVFKLIENNAGWAMIEYSPGLRGYISDLVKATKSIMPKPGTYTVKNKATDKLKVESDGTAWTAAIGPNKYNGKAFGNVIVFFDTKNNPAYSLVDLGNGPIVMSYDNSVTNFF